MHFLLQIILLLIAATVATDVQTSRLEDGLLVKSGGSLRSHVASWTVLVTLEQPRFPVEQLWLSTIRLRQVISHRAQRVAHAILRSWNNRLEWVRGRLGPPPSTLTSRVLNTDILISPVVTTFPPSITTSNETNGTPGSRGKRDIPRPRRKRGLLNFVGELSSTLFGTVSQAQLDDLRRHVDEVSVNAARITHTINKMITVVNQTQDIIEDDQRHIMELKDFTLKLQTKFSAELSSLQPEIVRLRSIANIEVLLATIEQQTYLLDRSHDLQHQRKADLEAGRLTEAILPVSDLTNIIDAAHGKGLRPPSTYQWFYEHSKIEPLWSEEDESLLVYRVILPFVDGDIYDAYTLMPFPVPANNFVVILKTALDISINTRSGDVHTPRHCVGQRPRVCRVGPAYGDGRFDCELGVISGDRTKAINCLIRAVNSTLPIIDELTPGEFVVITHGETITIQCVGQRTSSVDLPEGAHYINFRPGCILQGAIWRIEGIQEYQRNITKAEPILNLQPIGIPELVQNSTLSVPTLDWTPLKHLHPTHLEQIDEPAVSFPSIIHPSILHPILWTVASLILIILCIVISYAVVSRRCRKSSMTPQSVIWRRSEPRLVVEVANEQVDDNVMPTPTAPDWTVKTRVIPAILPHARPSSLLQPGPVYPELP